MGEQNLTFISSTVDIRTCGWYLWAKGLLGADMQTRKRGHLRGRAGGAELAGACHGQAHSLQNGRKKEQDLMCPVLYPKITKSELGPSCQEECSQGQVLPPHMSQYNYPWAPWKATWFLICFSFPDLRECRTLFVLLTAVFAAPWQALFPWEGSMQPEVGLGFTVSWGWATCLRSSWGIGRSLLQFLWLPHPASLPSVCWLPDTAPRPPEPCMGAEIPAWVTSLEHLSFTRLWLCGEWGDPDEVSQTMLRERSLVGKADV